MNAPVKIAAMNQHQYHHHRPYHGSAMMDGGVTYGGGAGWGGGGGGGGGDFPASAVTAAPPPPLPPPHFASSHPLPNSNPHHQPHHPRGEHAAAGLIGPPPQGYPGYGPGPKTPSPHRGHGPRRVSYATSQPMRPPEFGVHPAAPQGGHGHFGAPPPPPPPVRSHMSGPVPAQGPFPEYATAAAHHSHDHYQGHPQPPFQGGQPRPLHHFHPPHLASGPTAMPPYSGPDQHNPMQHPRSMMPLSSGAPMHIQRSPQMRSPPGPPSPAGAPWGPAAFDAEGRSPLPQGPPTSRPPVPPPPHHEHFRPPPLLRPTSVATRSAYDDAAFCAAPPQVVPSRESTSRTAAEEIASSPSQRADDAAFPPQITPTSYASSSASSPSSHRKQPAELDVASILCGMREEPYSSPSSPRKEGGVEDCREEQGQDARTPSGEGGDHQQKQVVVTPELAAVRTLCLVSANGNMKNKSKTTEEESAGGDRQATSFSPSSQKRGLPTRLSCPQDRTELSGPHCFLRDELIEIFCIPIEIEAASPEGDEDGEEKVNVTDKKKKKKKMIERIGFRCVHCASVQIQRAAAAMEAEKRAKGIGGRGSSRSHEKSSSSPGGKPSSSPSPSTSSSLPSPSLAHHSSGSIAPMGTFFPKSLAEIYGLINTWQRVHFRKCRHVPPVVRRIFEDLKKTDKRRGSTKYWATAARQIGLADDIEFGRGLRFVGSRNGEAEPSSC